MRASSSHRSVPRRIKPLIRRVLSSLSRVSMFLSVLFSIPLVSPASLYFRFLSDRTSGTQSPAIVNLPTYPASPCVEIYIHTFISISINSVTSSDRYSESRSFAARWNDYFFRVHPPNLPFRLFYFLFVFARQWCLFLLLTLDK